MMLIYLEYLTLTYKVFHFLDFPLTAFGAFFLAGAYLLPGFIGVLEDDLKKLSSLTYVLPKLTAHLDNFYNPFSTLSGLNPFSVIKKFLTASSSGFVHLREV